MGEEHINKFCLLIAREIIRIYQNFGVFTN